MGISASEIIFIFLFILIFFGANKIPDFARTLGKGMREFKRAADSIKHEIASETNDITKEIREIRNDVSNSVRSSDMAKDIREIKQDLNKTISDSNPIQ